LPIVCVTNGLRIASLTLLAEYVDPSFLHGSLHRQGGMGFFLLALLLLFAILQPLRGRAGPLEQSVNPPQRGDQASTSPAK
jgi:exosortase/archaeosortase family protein